MLMWWLSAVGHRPLACLALLMELTCRRTIAPSVAEPAALLFGLSFSPAPGIHLALCQGEL